MSHNSQLCEATLIAKVKEHPHLYDIHHKDYKDTRKCIQTWNLIARELGCFGEWKMCKERWRTLRDVYVRNRKSFMVGDTMRKKPRWRFFDQMHFLDAYINHRPPDPEVYAILASQWVGPGDVETVLCEEENDESVTFDNHDDNSNSASFTGEHLVVTTVDGKPIKEEMVEWIDEEIDVNEVATDGDSMTSGRNSAAAVAAFTAQWNDEKTPRKKARKVHHKSLDSLPIQIKNISGSQGRTKGSVGPQDSNKDKEHSPTDAGENTFSNRTLPGCHTQDIKPNISTKCEYALDGEEELFGRYIAAAIKKLTNKSKSLAKMRIQEVLFNLEESDRNMHEEKLKTIQKQPPKKRVD